MIKAAREPSRLGRLHIRNRYADSSQLFVILIGLLTYLQGRRELADHGSLRHFISSYSWLKVSWARHPLVEQ